MYPYQTVIFDLDGTLLDTLQDLADSTNYALSVHRMPARTLEEVRTFVGNGVGRLIHLAVPEGTPAEEEAACLADFRAHYLLNMENKTAPYPGVPALLEHLQAAGIRTAVVSNKFDGAVKGLCQNYFGDRLPVAIGESQGVARKPAPDTVFRALAELEAEPAGAVYVGDSDVDIATAQNAGLPCISVSWGFRGGGVLSGARAPGGTAAPAGGTGADRRPGRRAVAGSGIARGGRRRCGDRQPEFGDGVSPFLWIR